MGRDAKVFLLNRKDQSQYTSVAEWAVTSVLQQYCGIFLHKALEISLLPCRIHDCLDTCE